MKAKFDKKKITNRTTRDEIKNKNQLETINVNKTILIKRRMIDQKKKNKLKGWYNFLHDQHVIWGRKRRKRNKSQLDPN